MHVRPHLDYCSSIWSPYFAKDIDVLEREQKRATKLIKGFGKLSYDQRLKFLHLFCHCERGYYITTTFFMPATATYARGHCMKLFKSHYSRLIVHSNFFTQRVINSWNNLTDEIISSNTVGQFKSK